MRSYNADRSDNVLYKHKHNEHAGEDIKFSMKITKKFRDPLSRQANEAVRISNRPKGEILNSKNEFNHPPIARVVVERGGKNPPRKYPQNKSENGSFSVQKK